MSEEDKLAHEAWPHQPHIQASSSMNNIYSAVSSQTELLKGANENAAAAEQASYLEQGLDEALIILAVLVHYYVSAHNS